MWEPPVFIPTDRPEAASLIPITRGYFEEIVYILRLSRWIARCFECILPPIRVLVFALWLFRPLFTNFAVCIFLMTGNIQMFFVEQPFIYPYLLFLIWTLCYIHTCIQQLLRKFLVEINDLVLESGQWIIAPWGSSHPADSLENKFKLSNSNKNKNSTLFLDVCIIIMVWIVFSVNFICFMYTKLFGLSE